MLQETYNFLLETPSQLIEKVKNDVTKYSMVTSTKIRKVKNSEQLGLDNF